LHKLIDVTIFYPDGIPSFWQFICSDVPSVSVNVTVQELDHLIALDYFSNPDEKEMFQQWLNNHWLQKDSNLQRLSETSTKA
jgi:hypothetical protein